MVPMNFLLIIKKVFFTNDVHGIDLLTSAGYYAIFNPWDGHKSKVMNGAPVPIKKIIVKISEKQHK